MALLRKSAGSSDGAGGQFAQTEHEEAEVELTADEIWERAREYNEGHTFEDPPYPVDADQIVDFWHDAEIPSEVTQLAMDRFFTNQHRSMVVDCVRGMMMAFDARELRKLNDNKVPCLEEQRTLGYTLKFPNGYTCTVRELINGWGVGDIVDAQNLRADTEGHPLYVED